MKGIYAIERQFGKGAHLFWFETTGGVRGHNLGCPGENGEYAVGVILQENKVLRTVTALVDRPTMRKLDTAICKGELEIPPQGSILDSSSLLMAQQAPETTQASGVR